MDRRLRYWIVVASVASCPAEFLDDDGKCGDNNSNSASSMADDYDG